MSSTISEKQQIIDYFTARAPIDVKLASPILNGPAAAQSECFKEDISSAELAVAPSQGNHENRNLSLHQPSKMSILHAQKPQQKQDD